MIAIFQIEYTLVLHNIFIGKYMRVASVSVYVVCTRVSARKGSIKIMHNIFPCTFAITCRKGICKYHCRKVILLVSALVAHKIFSDFFTKE